MHPSQHDFREAMSQCAAGIHVITTDGTAGRFGITMTAVAPVTDTPPTLVLCVNSQALICPVLVANRQLCVNVLAAHQQDVAEHFAGMTALTPAERFEQHIWHRGPTGQLQIEGALAYLHGNIIDHREVGTHHVFSVAIEHINTPQQEQGALVYFRRQFLSLR
ncbi:MAG: 4-hydroxyphenylacetate 3-monooxygenase, reductase component [Alysiella sp.]|uniref:4-hydroxyphenylacetate 3-monooxygenase, reductase component n=1 Tax=Alysiella sp. TaxID=1872483 RepID=UPI0026DD0B5C|nr:4-hydroxyphenylacetate 3-monooxygenase, reductase component [Alysiella sp.]MDO4434325.1 4-hydroxyphenylacetate 3-monooxygenase, reductase component [Alysiella sp.]